MGTKRHLSRFSCVVGLVLFMGCGDTTHPLKHELASPVRSQASWNWLELTESEYSRDILSHVGSPQKLILSKEFEPLESRAQFWLNEMDQALRREYPLQMKLVPSPRARVIRNESLNAFVSSDFVCYNVKVRFAGSSSQKEVDGVFLDFSENEFKNWPSEQSCYESKEIDSLLASLEEFNQNSNHCKLELVADQILAKGDCKRSESLEDVSKATKFVMPRTNNWLTIHSGLFSSIPTEEIFVSILAHEASHYYRSHGTRLPSEFDFFYKQGDQTTDRPVPNPKLKDQGEKAIAASEFLNFPLDSSSLLEAPSELYLATGSLAKEFCAIELNHCSKSCKILGSADKNKSFVVGMGGFPVQTPPDEAVYKKFINLSTKCLQSIPDNDQTRSLWIQALHFPKWMPLSEYLSYSEIRLLMRIVMGIPDRLGKFPKTMQENMHAVLKHLSANLKQKHNNALADLKTAKDLEIVQYTSEQEADELMGEILTILGLNPAHGVEGFLFLAGERENGMEGFLMGATSCREWYQRGWRGPEGDFAFVPVGDYSDSHHSVCFRAFNLDRDLKRHGFPLNSKKMATDFAPPGGSWSGMQELAKKATQTPLGDWGEDEEMAPFRGSFFGHAQGLLKRCPLNPRYFPHFVKHPHHQVLAR